MDIKIENEPLEIDEPMVQQEIKKENELIIENEQQWIPMKLADEENEYYEEFVVLKNVYNGNNESTLEQFTIKFLEDNNEEAENEEYAYNEDGDESDDEEEIAMDNEYNTNLKRSSTCQKTEFYKFSFAKYLKLSCVKRECPACRELFDYNIKWQSHLLNDHKDLQKAAEENYTVTGNLAICKLCNEERSTEITRYLHYIRHRENGSENIVCNICKFKSTKMRIIIDHTKKEHPEIVEQYEKSEAKKNTFVCLICSNAYTKFCHLVYHVKDTHTEAYFGKYIYCCHLCKRNTFNDEEDYLHHLLEEHNLYNWQVLKYQKILNEKDYFACKKCENIFIQNNSIKLLKHYLLHDENSFWKCKFCYRKIPHSKPDHICYKMMQFYANQRKVCENQKNAKEKLQEFQDYIVHVCPFCNTEFDKMVKWQLHLRNEHAIDTLKGLEMKAMANDNNKLQCLICHTVVANIPKQLHEHRFQHLPHLPYKCRHCSLTLNTFQMALNHMQKSCNDEEDRYYIKLLMSRVNSNLIFDADKGINARVCIHCPFCNYQKFTNPSSLSKHLEDDHDSFKEFFTIQSDSSCTCKVCQKQFKKYDKLPCCDHVSLHFNENFFKCTMCAESFSKFKHCYKHLVYNHFIESINQLQSLEKARVDDKEENKLVAKSMLAKATVTSHTLNEFAEFVSFACPECNEILQSQEEWHKHIITEHNFFNKTNMIFEDSDGILKCLTCKKKMHRNPTNQQQHKLTHMPFRPYICTLCYSRFNTLSILFAHFRSRHFAAGSFKCFICSEVLSTEYQRTDHIKTKHQRNEWPPYMCLICYKLFSWKSKLNEHMLTHDEDRVKHTCEICGSKVKKFQVHMDKHIERGETKRLAENDITTQPSSSKYIAKSIQENNLRIENKTDEDCGDTKVDQKTDVLASKVEKKKYTKRKSSATSNIIKKEKLN